MCLRPESPPTPLWKKILPIEGVNISILALERMKKGQPHPPIDLRIDNSLNGPTGTLLVIVIFHGVMGVDGVSRLTCTLGILLVL